jgi:hypothetical protein
MTEKKQNISTAVMQRRVEPHDSLDDFPTPPWATRAVCELLESYGIELAGMSVREPCANRGYMAVPLMEYFGAVLASDICDYGCGYSVRDYLFGPDNHFDPTDWTFLNPPFRLAAQFIERALRLSNVGVAVIVRTAFLEGKDRYETLFKSTPPWVVAVHSERVPMVKGKYDPCAASATSYSWLIWRKDTAERLPIDWIAPCRRRLELPDDIKIGEAA